MRYAKAIALGLLVFAIASASVDLTTTALSAQPAPQTGMRSMITAVVKNIGDTAAGEFQYCINFDGRQYAALPVSGLAAGAQTEVKVFWWAQQNNLGNRMVQGVADCTRKQMDSNRGNNEMSIPVTVTEGKSVGTSSLPSQRESISNNLFMAITTTPQGLLAFIGVCATAVLVFVFLSRRQE